MAIKPEDCADSYTTAVVAEIEQYIDGRMSDARWVHDWRRGPDPETGLSFWDHIIRYELNSATKNEVIRRYTEAGWKRVKVLNSSENRERPGICCVTLYK